MAHARHHEQPHLVARGVHVAAEGGLDHALVIVERGLGLPFRVRPAVVQQQLAVLALEEAR